MNKAAARLRNLRLPAGRSRSAAILSLLFFPGFASACEDTQPAPAIDTSSFVPVAELEAQSPPWEGRIAAGLWRLVLDHGGGRTSTRLYCYGGQGALPLLEFGNLPVEVGGAIRNDNRVLLDARCGPASFEHVPNGWRSTRICQRRPPSSTIVFSHSLTGDLGRRINVVEHETRPRVGAAGNISREIERVGDCPEGWQPGDELAARSDRPDGPFSIRRDGNDMELGEPSPQLRSYLAPAGAESR